jgi:hypothetical protein
LIQRNKEPVIRRTVYTTTSVNSGVQDVMNYKKRKKEGTSYSAYWHCLQTLQLLSSTRRSTSSNNRREHCLELPEGADRA